MPAPLRFVSARRHASGVLVLERAAELLVACADGSQRGRCRLDGAAARGCGSAVHDRVIRRRRSAPAARQSRFAVGGVEIAVEGVGEGDAAGAVGKAVEVLGVDFGEVGAEGSARRGG